MTETVVDYCLNNVSTKIRRTLRESEVHTNEYTCVGHCGECYRRPFLVVDDELVFDNHHECIRSLTDPTNG